MLVLSMYSDAKTVVRTVYGDNSCFEVKISMLQGSACSSLPFVIIMEDLSRELRQRYLIMGVVVCR